MIPYSESMNEYMPLKIALLLAFVVLSFVLKKIIIDRASLRLLTFSLWTLISFLWGDYNISTTLIQFGYFGSIILTYYLAVNYKVSLKNSVFFFVILIGLEFTIHFLNFGYFRGSIGGAYIIGSTSILFLLLEKRVFRRLIFVTTLPVYVALAGRRFVLVHLLTFFSKNYKRLLFLGFLGYIIVACVTYFTKDINLYMLLIGYRAFEYQVAFDSIINLIFGHGMGTDILTYIFPSKGRVEHVGVFHNFYITIAFQYGLIGLVLFFRFINEVLRVNRTKTTVVFLAAWLIVALIDGPRDGHWPIGLLCGIIINSKSYVNSSSSINGGRISRFS